jgi:transposase
MTNFSELRVFLCLLPTSMRFSFDRLMGLAERTFNQDPLSGHLFLFVNRDRDRIKILFWDQDGFCIFYKRLEAGTFQLPAVPPEATSVALSGTQLTLILGGVDLASVRQRKRYRRGA